VSASAITAAEGLEGTAVDGRGRRARPKWQTVGRRLLTLAIIAGAVWAGYDHRSELSTAGTMLSHLQVGWLFLAVVFEMASMVVFARMQR
jgi:TRAP-type C4-dicarboxylate transport system permease small subunit